VESLNQQSLLTLWAMPKKEEIPSVLSAKKIIDEELHGPSFPIHMTLAGEFDLDITSMKTFEYNLCNNFTPFEVHFRGYGMKNYFFQAFYVAVELNEKLQTTRSKICEAFSIEDGEFMPHLSLYYGKQKEERKRTLLSQLPEIEGSFLAETFYVVSFDPKNIEWKILNSIQLGGHYND
tara:strand:+ start:205 stop:738 length:534 start_codon:yes stop_codon:yes gene_type:complete